MRVLFLSVTLPLPANNGHKMRTLSVLRSLAADGHEVVFLTFAHPEELNGKWDELSKICTTVEIVPLALTNLTSSSHLVGRLFGLFSSQPYATSRFSSSTMQERVRDVLLKGNLDAVICDTVYSACNLPATSLPILLNSPDVEHLILERYLPFERNAVKKTYARLESRKVRKWEQKVCQMATIGMACSEHDCCILRRIAPQLPFFVVPNVVDAANYAPQGSDAEKGEVIVYQGGMDWFPNRDAVEYFVAEIFPIIARELPGARFVVAGRNPSEGFRKQFTGVKNLQFTGTVPDMRPIIAQAAVCVVPLRIGSGTRLKILEAAAMGKAVVSTPLGAEGLEFECGRQILLCDRPVPFALAVLDLLKDPARRRKMGIAARRVVEQKYSFDVLRGAVSRALAAVKNNSTSSQTLLAQA